MANRAGFLSQNAALIIGADPLCPTCGHPVPTGTLRHFERGEFSHVYCHSRQLQLRALEQGADAPHADAVRPVHGPDAPTPEAPQ
jgi:hypothetical protein